VDNAIKYTPAGSIQISVREYDLFCRIDVADTGIGISEAEQAKIFARFYRSQSVSEQEGAGIGLYLTRLNFSGAGRIYKSGVIFGRRRCIFDVFAPKGLNPYKTVRIACLPERFWKETYDKVCIVANHADFVFGGIWQ